MGKLMMLDCTLRDGAYIVNSMFGTPAIKGIIKKMQDARIDLIECGWLKNTPHESGSSFYHIPSDIEQYFVERDPKSTYLVMIDWDRYDLNVLPEYDGRSIDAIRIVFPKEHYREGIALGNVVREKGYKVYYQAANTLGYSDDDLRGLAEEVNKIMPESLSVVDTFGAMYTDDLERIVGILNDCLEPGINLGFHSHNNQQLSFALSMRFAELLSESPRDLVIDASLCGIGRGAGNATTELVASYLNRKHHGNYDMNVIMDAIDMYMGHFIENYSWGYSTPYFISGLYCAHVNNIAYLLKNHRTNAMDMRNIIESLSEEDRKKYDYDLLEQKYLDYQNKIVDDSLAIDSLSKQICSKKVLLILPGSSVVSQRQKIIDYINVDHPVVIGVNAWLEGFDYDFLFFSNSVRYDYAKDIYAEPFSRYRKIVTSNVKTVPDENDYIINFNLLVKRGWQHFDNAGIMALRFMNKIGVSDVAIAGFDGFEDGKADDYADASLPHINPGKKWDELNEEISEMLADFKSSTKDKIRLSFITDSMFDTEA